MGQLHNYSTLTTSRFLRKWSRCNAFAPLHPNAGFQVRSNLVFFSMYAMQIFSGKNCFVGLYLLNFCRLKWHFAFFRTASKCMLKDYRLCFRFVSYVSLLIYQSIFLLSMFALNSFWIKTGMMKMSGVWFLFYFVQTLWNFLAWHVCVEFFLDKNE